jgi:uncharacterized protein YceH (UPF0502 family)
MLSNLNPVAQRLLGCLIEKEMTTPDYYPMTANALVNAANQKSNRSPVMELAESDVLGGIDQLREEGLVRAVRPKGDRSVKYKHAAEDVLEVAPQQAALLAVLLLRGSQTAGELRARTGRYHDFGSLAEVEQNLASLIEAEYVERLDRRPGEKEARFRHLLGEAGPSADDGLPIVPAETGAAWESPDLAAKLEMLERRVARLESLHSGEPDY